MNTKIAKKQRNQKRGDKQTGVFTVNFIIGHQKVTN